MDSSKQNGSDIARMIWIVGSPIIFTIGVFGNIMTIIVLTNKRNKKTSSTIFLTFLAFADLLVMTIMLPRWWFIYMFGFDVRHIHNIVCKIQFFANYFCGTYSSSLLAAVTIERAICTVKPYKVKTICTVQVAIIISIALFCTVCAIHGHVLVGIHLYEVSYNVKSETRSMSFLRESNERPNDTFEIMLANASDDDISIERMLGENCSIASNLSIREMVGDLCTSIVPNDETAEIRKMKVCWYDDLRYGNFFSEIHQIVATVCYLIIPEIIFFVSDFIIVKSLKKSKSLRRRMRTEYMRNSGHKPAFDNRATQITLTLVLVNIVFVFTTSPALIYLMGMSSWVDEDIGMTAAQEISWAVVNMMIYINHSVNFILYFLSGYRFRRQVLETFQCIKPANARDTSVSMNHNGTSTLSSSYDLNLK